MSDLKIEGTIQEIQKLEQVTDSFQKQVFILETDDQYPQIIKFEAHQNYCDQLGNYSSGDIVRVHFNVKGRPWENSQGKTIYFVTLNAWRIEKLGTSSIPPMETDIPPIDEGMADDLPF